MFFRSFVSCLSVFLLAHRGICETKETLNTAEISATKRAGSECDLWANNGECDANPKYMQEFCKASCDAVAFRDLPTGSKCDHWANDGECDKDPGFMLENCRASCVAVKNKDLRAGSKCDYWAENGECYRNPYFMLENCKGSCVRGTTNEGNPFGSECDFLADNGDCDKNPDFMQDFCKASCDAVSRAGSECNFWAKNGECDKHPDFMQENCKASCDAMTSGVVRAGAECDIWRNNGECDANPEYMQEFCKASCQLGTTLEGKPYGEECDFWANHGECDKNSDYMQNFCKSSCDQLRSLEKEEVPVQAGSECDNKVDKGECDTNPEIMLLYCKGSCEQNISSVVPVQAGSECDYWADNGECEISPDFMQKNCKASCKEAEMKMMQDIGHIQSFYDLNAVDIDGKSVNFEGFRRKVTIVVNVASYYKFTELHYRELVALHKDLTYTNTVEILGFPCNQFGEEESEPLEEIKAFAQRRGVEFNMMEKIEVNGLNAHPVYKYLKMKANLPKIEWSFATYFVIDLNGSVHPFSGIRPSQLKDAVLGLLDKEL